ncbi:MAG: hypothetical protein ACRDQA_07090 [Nocardioidaceae bacterium]
MGGADRYLVQLLDTFDRLNDEAVEIGEADSLSSATHVAVTALETAGVLSSAEARTWRARFAEAYKRIRHPPAQGGA